jgi:hypothetical protein
MICPADPEFQDAVSTNISCRVSAVQRVACCGMLSFNCAGNTSKMFSAAVDCSQLDDYAPPA